MKLSIVIPAYNEEGSITETLQSIYQELLQQQIEHEIVVVNDNSKDNNLYTIKITFKHFSIKFSYT